MVSNKLSMYLITFYSIIRENKSQENNKKVLKKYLGLFCNSTILKIEIYFITSFKTKIKSSKP